MPCDDCSTVQTQLSRLRFVIEQNFTAVFRRLDHQDHNLLIVTELLGDDGPSKFHRPLVRAGPKRRVGRVHWKLSAVNSKRARSKKSSNSGNVVGEVERPIEAADGDHRAVSGEIDEHGGMSAEDNLRFVEDHRESRDSTHRPNILISPIAVASSPIDQQRIQQFADCTIPSTSDFDQDLVDQMDFDGIVGGATDVVNEPIIENRFESIQSEEANEEDFDAIAAGNGGASTSGTARVTVRSAIRMEDLGRSMASNGFNSTISTYGGSGSVGEGGDVRSNDQAIDHHSGDGQIVEDQRFDTMEVFIDCLLRYERSNGIVLSVANSKLVETANKTVLPGKTTWDTRYKYAFVELRCSKSGGAAIEQCPFRLLLNNSRAERCLIITRLIESHSAECTVSQHSHNDASRMRVLRRLL